jgi:hypothetical protein
MSATSCYKTKLAIELCGQHFGEVPKLILTRLINSETSTLLSLVRFFAPYDKLRDKGAQGFDLNCGQSGKPGVSLNTAEIKKALLILIQHGCVTVHTPFNRENLEEEDEGKGDGEGITLLRVPTNDMRSRRDLIYIAQRDAIILRLRFSKMIELAKGKFGQDGKAVVAVLALHGRLTRKDIIDAAINYADECARDQSGEDGDDVEATLHAGQDPDPDSPEPALSSAVAPADNHGRREAIEKVLAHLLAETYVKPVVLTINSLNPTVCRKREWRKAARRHAKYFPHPDAAPLNLQFTYLERPDEHDEEMDFGVGAGEGGGGVKWRSEDQGATAIVVGKRSRASADGKKKKVRKAKRTSLQERREEAIAEARRNEEVDHKAPAASVDVTERTFFALNNETFLRALRHRAAVRYVKDTMNAKAAYVVDAMLRLSLPFEGTSWDGYSRPLSLKEVWNEVSKLQASDGIGEPINLAAHKRRLDDSDEDEEDIAKFTRKKLTEIERKNLFISDLSKLEDVVGVLREHPQGIVVSHRLAMTQQAFHNFQEREEYIASCASKNSGIDTSFKGWGSSHVHIRRVGDGNAEKRTGITPGLTSIFYSVNLGSLMSMLRKRVIADVVSEKYGAASARILQLLQTRMFLDQQQICDLGITPINESRQRLYRLLQDGWVKYVDLNKRSDQNASGVSVLWYVDARQLEEKIVQQMYKGLFNLRWRLVQLYERNEWKRRLRVTDRAEYARRQKSEAVLSTLENCLLRLDDTVLVLEEF